jgi:hypothetical protein
MVELTRRYIVMQMAAEGPFDITDPDAPFVLKPWKDPAALQALIVYREHCYPELAQELDQWIQAIAAGPKVRGGIGSRNELTALASRKTVAGSKPRAKAPKVKTKARRAKKLKNKTKRRS